MDVDIFSKRKFVIIAIFVTVGLIFLIVEQTCHRWAGAFFHTLTVFTSEQETRLTQTPRL